MANTLQTFQLYPAQLFLPEYAARSNEASLPYSHQLSPQFTQTYHSRPVWLLFCHYLELKHLLFALLSSTDFISAPSYCFLPTHTYTHLSQQFLPNYHFSLHLLHLLIWQSQLIHMIPFLPPQYFWRKKQDQVCTIDLSSQHFIH